MRFLSPARPVPRYIFEHPVFADHAGWRDWLDDDAWPDIADISDRLSPLRHVDTGLTLSFVDQVQAGDDGRHYEARIHDTGIVATRANNWHDLFNALAWKRCTAIKSALNLRQVQDLAQVGPRARTRAQHALTHFDEAGIVVVMRDAAALRAWDEHDWPGLFLDHREAWLDGRIQWLLVGHAVLEHALDPAMWLVAKALVFDATDVVGTVDAAVVDTRAASVMRNGDCLRDPQELRPLPVSGIPGWRSVIQDAAFYRDAPCFQARREGRRYPAPLPWIPA